MNKLIFIGILDSLGQNGETMKNRLFVQRFREIYDKVYVFNAKGVKHRPWKIIRLGLLALMHPKTKIVVSASYSIGEPLIKILWLIGRKDIYYWMVGGTFHEKIKNGELSSQFYKRMKLIIVQDEHMKQSLEKHGWKNIAYVPNTKRIDYLPQKEINKSGKVRFVFLSRVHPTKGCGEIAESVKTLNNLGYQNKFCVDFYGAIDACYPEFPNILDGIPNASYKGFLNLNGKDGYDTLSAYDIMLFPTYWDGEGFPGVVIDAYIAGLPVIASDWNLNKYYIDEGTGKIIPHHNTEKLTEAMKSALDVEMDVLGMSKNCQSRAMQYDNRKVITKERLIELSLY